MDFLEDLGEKRALVRRHFASVIGDTLVGYELPEIRNPDERRWVAWHEVAIVLRFSGEAALSVSWRKFRELGVAAVRVLHNDTGVPLRWTASAGSAAADLALGRVVNAVLLGRDRMSIGTRESVLWPRLLIRFADGSGLEIANSLDSNEYLFHSEIVAGMWLKCAG